MHLLGSRSLKGALAKFDDESDAGDDNEKDGATDDDAVPKEAPRGPETHPNIEKTCPQMPRGPERYSEELGCEPPRGPEEPSEALRGPERPREADLRPRRG